ncbi:DUF317 domain-containing protein [Streptomyces calidiresistens]|uniref:DUF317 domain-containing protein n=1 Tax=Streptomyces calidiresistens TaxID=1485586 RepID=A0A7W3T2E3_9ACTN|nr:DUF317 domain-containing protein [Streptomyces calidiresistens]MBB0229677.1 DUF317 domain-containing protein [Streptomyces calidiresistens]
MPPHDAPRPIDGDVYVSPRHLAAATPTGDAALQPLLDAGWEMAHDDLGNLHVHAPDRRIRLGYLPEGEDDGLWRINAYEDPFGPPTWGACFNNTCPTEFVHAFTTALARAYSRGPQAYLASPSPIREGREPALAIDPLVNRGWRASHDRRGTLELRAPDGLAGLAIPTGRLDPEKELTTRDARWQLWAGTSNDHPAWYATASTHTPVALIRAVTECVSDPAPLPRWRKDTHSYIQGMARLTPLLPPDPPGPTPLDMRRLAGRRPAALPSPSVPRWSTTSGPPRPGSRR